MKKGTPKRAPAKRKKPINIDITGGYVRRKKI